MSKPSFREGLTLLREPGFARLFAARLVSAFGSAMAPIALPLRCSPTSAAPRGTSAR